MSFSYGAGTGRGSWQPPLFRLGRIPITVTNLVILLEVVGMLIVVMVPSGMDLLAVFDPHAFTQGSLWQVISYPFFGAPSVWLLLGLYFFYHFGSQVEGVIGRSSYVRLLLAVTLTPPVVVLLAHFLSVPGFLVGSHVPHLAVLVAAIAMTPNAPSAFFGFPIKWFAIVFVALGLLQFAMMRNWGGCLALISTVYLSVWWMRQAGHVGQWGVVEDVLGTRSSRPRRQKKASPKKRVYEKKLKPRSKVTPSKNKDIDRILDKISEEGLHSLTDDERKLLQEASRK